MCCATFVVRQAGSDLSITINLLNASHEGVSGLVDSDLSVRLHEPTAGVSTPTITLTELDSGAAPGWYRLEVAADQFGDVDDEAALVINHTTPTTLIPCVVNLQIAPKFWRHYYEDFKALKERLADFLTQRGVP